MQHDRDFTFEDRAKVNPCSATSINQAMDLVRNPVSCCRHVQYLIRTLVELIFFKKDDPKTKDNVLYHGETWELMGRRWSKIEKDFYNKGNGYFDISKIPEIYDAIKYDICRKWKVSRCVTR